jgi:hypothetical protein
MASTDESNFEGVMQSHMLETVETAFLFTSMKTIFAYMKIYEEMKMCFIFLNLKAP